VSFRLPGYTRWRFPLSEPWVSTFRATSRDRAWMEAIHALRWFAPVLFWAGLLGIGLLSTARAEAQVAEGDSASFEEEVGPGSWHRHGEPRALGLDEAVRMGVHRSPVLHSAETRVDAAHGRRLEAYGSFLPSLDLGYAFSTSNTGRLDPTGQEITNTSWTTQLGGRYEVLPGLTRASGAQAARRRARAAEARYRETRHRVAFEAKVAWFEAVAAGEQVRVEERRVARQGSQVDSVEALMAAGRVARPDLLRARVALNDARMALIRARSAARDADFALARVVGADEPVTPRVEEVPEPEPLPLGLAELIRAAVGAGPAIEGARAEVEAARAEVTRSASAYLPNLALRGGLAWNSPEFPPRRRSWQIVVQGSYPLFDGLSREARLDEAQATARAAESDARLTELQLREDVAAAYDLVQTGLEAVELAEQTVELSREELEMQRERFRLGRGSILEVQEAEAGPARAEADRVRARFEYHRGRAELEYRMGRELAALEAER